MKVYLSQGNAADEALVHFSNVSSFSRGVMDSEATQIICDCFLSTFLRKDVASVLDIILKKMRANCELTIIEPDFYLISKHIFHEDVDIDVINDLVFSQGAMKSMLSMDKIEKMIGNGFEISSKHFDEQSCRSILKIKRAK
tara:strand:- start:6367 stop:6789 length:423 start_codon:yes stop_codon:yes gene_type:complete